MKRFIGILSILVSIACVTALTVMNDGPEEHHDETSLMQVHTIRIQPQTVTDIVIGYGQIRPRWQTTTSSEVSGRVLEVSDKFLSGSSFNKDDVLAIIDNTAYVAALKNRKVELATAKRVLEEEEQRSKIAKENWKSSGFKGKPSDLVLRKPQMSEAKMAIDAAYAAIKKAEYDLERTKITVPYDGIVINRNINPGDYAQEGALIGAVYDRSLYEVVVPLGLNEITRLSDDRKKQSVILRSERSDNKMWHGKVTRIEQVVDAQNRWQNVIVSVEDTEGLLPGEFVEVEFTGHSYDDVIAVPENLPANDGYVWYVDVTQKLQRFSPDILFRKDGLIFIRMPFDRPGSIQLTVGRDIFMPDLQVTPIAKSESSIHQVGRL
ncbi:MAG: efflux RND transporter periplasmic adaptor subunit [Alphaproteobacteria bacterium]